MFVFFRVFGLVSCFFVDRKVGEKRRIHEKTRNEDTNQHEYLSLN
jgi:hypothetical protein